MGVGDGSLGSRADYIMGTAPTGVAIADLNGDRHLDVVASCAGGTTVTSPGTVAVRLGDGSGLPGSATSFSSGTSVSTFSLGDSIPEQPSNAFRTAPSILHHA